MGNTKSQENSIFEVTLNTRTIYPQSLSGESFSFIERKGNISTTWSNIKVNYSSDSYGVPKIFGILVAEPLRFDVLTLIDKK